MFLFDIIRMFDQASGSSDARLVRVTPTTPLINEKLSNPWRFLLQLLAQR